LRLGIRLKLFLVSVGLILLTVAAFDLWMSREIAEYVTTTIRDDLYVRANVVAREAGELDADADDLAKWDAHADALGKTLEARVTFVRLDGKVLGDSEVDLAALPRVESHVDRPEVVLALATGRGASERVSTTIDKRLLYVGVPYMRDGKTAGVARVARPLSAVDAAVASARRALYTASAIAFALAVLVAAALAQRLTGTVRDLTDTARRMADGDLDVRTHTTGNDELGALGAALDALASSLSSTLGELRAERDLQLRILQGMQEGVLVTDEDQNVVLVNATLRSMLLVGADVMGKHVLEVVRVSELQGLLEKARTSRVPEQAEIEIGGIKPRRLLVHASALEGEDRGLLAVFVDVTDVRRLESLRRDFVANVSHELRTPVAAVLSATETLRTGALANPDAADRFLGIVERNATRLQALIEDLLELSRLDAREYRVKRAPLAVDALLTIVVGLYREKADKKGIRLVTSVPDPTPIISSDQRAIEQIIGNLVDNAIKYCPQGSRVTIRVEKTSEELRLHVEDNGPGIAERHLSRLFERFYRVDAGRSREVGGTGLGLSIVKHLAEALGGEVTAASTLGKGTTFTLALPSDVVSLR
jgi:two-component system phosphate regulon sensor histidine kinase PhoR